jgi:DNA-binding response OmpR family regulator
MNESLIATLKRLRILYVEDDEGIRKRVVSTLRYYFDEVYEASDGESGYDAYETYRPHIVLTDIMMPNSNGVELVENIRYNDSKTIIIVLSAHSNEEYLLSLINLHINHYFLKPINSTKLFDAFEKVLQSHLESTLELGSEIKLNYGACEATYNGQKVQLRKRECAFLYLLYQNKQLITTYAQIEEEIWQGKSMSMSALKTFIKELRKKLPVDIIINVAGEGYKLK